MFDPRAFTLLTVPNKEPENDGCSRAKYHHILMTFTFKKLTIRENNVKSTSYKKCKKHNVSSAKNVFS